jgi:hypothetical protein
VTGPPVSHHLVGSQDDFTVCPRSFTAKRKHSRRFHIAFSTVYQMDALSKVGVLEGSQALVYGGAL